MSGTSPDPAPEEPKDSGSGFLLSLIGLPAVFAAVSLAFIATVGIGVRSASWTPIYTYMMALPVAGLHWYAWKTRHKSLAVAGCMLSVLLVVWSGATLAVVTAAGESTQSAASSLGATPLFLNYLFASCVLSALLSLIPSYLLSRRSEFGATITDSWPNLKHALVLAGMAILLFGAAFEGAIRAPQSLDLAGSLSIEPSALATVFVALALTVLLLSGTILKFKALLFHCVFFAPIAMLVLQLSLYLQDRSWQGHIWSDSSLPSYLFIDVPSGWFPRIGGLDALSHVLATGILFAACSFVVRWFRELPRWLGHYIGVLFSLMVASWVVLLPEALASWYSRNFTVDHYLFSVPQFWLLIVVAACYGLAIIARSWYVAYTACLLIVWAVIGWFLDHFAFEELIPYGHIFALVSLTFVTPSSIPMLIASVFALVPAYFVRMRRMSQGHTGRVLLTILSYMLVASGCLALLCSLYVEGGWSVTAFAQFRCRSWLFGLLGTASGAITLVALGLIMLTAIGRLTKFRELLVVTTLATPLYAVFSTYHIMDQSRDTRVDIPIIMSAIVFAYHMWIHTSEPREGRLSKTMILSTEIGLCVFSFLATVVVASSVPDLDWYKSYWRLTYPSVVALWALLSLLAVWASRNSGRLVFRIAPIVALIVALAAGAFSSFRFATDTPGLLSTQTGCLLLSALCAFVTGALLVRDRLYNAFILWGRILWGLSALSVVFILWQNLAK